ncbi:hypothetical protein [Streptomyces longispororuber]|uniref:hypothetical protein n=1 Tax=Streptomyces longispororuber TaxID=68230 RepID=UPI00210DF404|nr:hypothetical protein [Streptomyces longispororuber]MCQ4213883.1 hypothetical protein [Streptomyces longispororuber]
MARATEYCGVGPMPGSGDALMGRGPRTLLGVPEFDDRFRVDTHDDAFARNLSPQAVEERLNYPCDVLDRIPAQTWAAG